MKGVDSMVRLGIVYEIHSSKAVVMTPDSEFLVIKRTRDMYVGQQVKFNIQDVRKTMKPVYKHASIASSIAAAFILVFMFFRISFNDNIYGYISVDINPSIEFSVDKEFEVIEAKALNVDGEVIVNELDAKGKNVYDVIEDILDESETQGYIKQDKNNIVLVSVSLNDKNREYSKNRSDDERELEGFLLELDEKLNSENTDYIKGRVIKVSPEERKAAEEKELSMGKYYLMEKAKESGVGLSSGELQTKEISDLLAAIYANNSDIADPEPTPNVQQGEVEATSSADSETVPANGKIASPTPSKTEKPTVKPNLTTPTAAKHDDAKPKPTASDSKVATATPEKAQNSEKSGLKLQILSDEKQEKCKIISSTIKVFNTGETDIDLSEIKVRYYFTKENNTDRKEKNTNLVSAVYNYSKGKGSYCMQQTSKDVVISFHEVSGTKTYMEIGFQTGILKKGEYAHVKSGFNKNDWSDFDQNNDYSFMANGQDFQDSKNITAYISDTLVWGIAPY